MERKALDVERRIPDSLKKIVKDSGTKIFRTLKANGKKKRPAKGRPDRRQVGGGNACRPINLN